MSRKSKKSGGITRVAKGIAFSAILFAVMVLVVENYNFYHLLSVEILERF